MFVKLIFASIVLSLTFNSFASNGLLSDEERESKLKVMAEDNVKKAWDDYLKKQYVCIKESEKQSLNKKDFDNIGLTNEEMKIVILYFSTKTIRACVGDIVDNYIIATNLARYFNVDGYSIKDDPDTEHSKYSADTLPISEMNYMADYLQISKEKREKLEKIKGLNNLFNLDNAINDLIKK